MKVFPTLKITPYASSEMFEKVIVTGMVATDKRLFTSATDKLFASDVKIEDLVWSLKYVCGATSIYGNSKSLWPVDGIR